MARDEDTAAELLKVAQQLAGELVAEGIDGVVVCRLGRWNH